PDQAFRLRGAPRPDPRAAAALRAGPAAGPQGRRPRPRPADAAGDPGGCRDRPHTKGVRDPRDPDAPRWPGRVAGADRPVGLGGRPRKPHQPRGRTRQPPAPEDRLRGPACAHPHGVGPRLPARRERGVTGLSLPNRLPLWHTGVVAAFLAVAAFAGHWALARLVLGQLDAALVALAETEASALESDLHRPVRVHEFAPGSAPPSFVRLDRFVQIIDLEG